MTDDALVASLLAAVERQPDDPVLRLHLATLLVDTGRGDDAVAHLAAVLQADPQSEQARALMRRAMTPAAPADAATATSDEPASPGPAPVAAGGDPLRALEEELRDVVPPRFVDDGAEEPLRAGPQHPGAEAWTPEDSRVRLDDVGGMDAVKERLEAAFLMPMRNPQLSELYGKSLSGGLLLYGPPGCGKTFLARAIAGELGAQFLHVAISDVLDMWLGTSERNLAAIFDSARGHAPCVLFFDEIDAIGHKRSNLQASAMRTTVNQLLSEMDGVRDGNDGVFVLGATNHPWDVDTALRRPGRFDRTLFVAPPDEPARAAILTYHLRRRPVENIDVRKAARLTDGFSGADLAHVCESAAELAMTDSVRSGTVRMIGQGDLERAIRSVRPSTGPWLDMARNVARYGNESGQYDELVAFLRGRKQL